MVLYNNTSALLF